MQEEANKFLKEVEPEQIKEVGITVDSVET